MPRGILIFLLIMIPSMYGLASCAARVEQKERTDCEALGGDYIPAARGGHALCVPKGTILKRY